MKRERDIITIDEYGRLNLPTDTAAIWMTEAEIAELFGILQDQSPVRRLLCVYGRVGAQLLKNGHKNLLKNQPNRSCMSAGRVNMERSVESMTPEDASS